MQFVKNGPEVPEALLEAHEEGRVVFFCGAGVSYPAGLPSFNGLVDDVYNSLNVGKAGPEVEALKDYKFDTALGLLERRLRDGRFVVRNAIAESLTPNLGAPKATQTHEALLTLSKSREGSTRLITTNFDRVFEEVIVKQKLDTKSFSAPLLPIPKNKWNGLVYLHGLLDHSLSDENLNSLVVTSGDFGLAYLVERWAARFVSELFRNYTVCFVGYSINDPILRYMMDALSADALMGETTPEAYAFGDFSKGRKDLTTDEWGAKNVTPILYHKHKNHYYLHETLHAWANNYRDGVNGKQAIVAKYAQLKPARSTKQDDYVRRMVWALSDDTGLPAKLFAEAEPLPSIEWLEVLKDERFGREDLSRFGVSQSEMPSADEGGETKFSILHRPCPSYLAPYMSVVARAGAELKGWDKVMEELSRWLARHINQAEVLFWAIGEGGKLHPSFIRELKGRLRAGVNISAPMKALWRLVLSGKTGFRQSEGSLFDWVDNFNEFGATGASRRELKEALRPMLQIRRPYSFGTLDSEASVEKISGIAHLEIHLKSVYARTALNQLGKTEGFEEFLPSILMDMSDLLFETIDLMVEVELSSELYDYSYIQLPSISEHEQNKDHDGWTFLVDLCRDSWRKTAETDPEAAIAMLTIWARSKYPIFRRLVFYAIAQKPELVSIKLVLDWLLSDGCHWLWSTSTMRETMRLLVSIGPVLHGEDSVRLQRIIVLGPPRSMFHENTGDEDNKIPSDRMRWIRLRRLVSSSTTITRETGAALEEIETTYPNWQLKDDDRDDFPSWSSSGTDAVVRSVPKKLEDLMPWLEENPTYDDFNHPDNWFELCRDNFRLSTVALMKLAKQGVWLVSRWKQALQAWSTDELILRSWKYTAKTIILMPEKEFREALHTIVWWVYKISTNVLHYETQFFQLIDRIIVAGLDDAGDGEKSSINQALNHPLGLAISSLLNWWFKTDLEDGQGLSDEIKQRFSKLCASDTHVARLGKIVLAQQLVPLFRVDPKWARENLLPSFSWEDNPDLAAAMWESFLQSPRLYWPLLSELKESFLKTPNHIDKFDEEYSAQYFRLLTYAALDTASPFQKSEFRDVFSHLPQVSFDVVAETLFNASQGAGNEAAKYIANRVSPFFKNYWSKAEGAQSQVVARYLAQICAISGSAFEETFRGFEYFLIPVEHFDYLLVLLGRSDLPESNPRDVIALLNLIIPKQVNYVSDSLEELISKAIAVDPTLADSPDYRRLSILVQQNARRN